MPGRIRTQHDKQSPVWRGSWEYPRIEPMAAWVHAPYLDNSKEAGGICAHILCHPLAFGFRYQGVSTILMPVETLQRSLWEGSVSLILYRQIHTYIKEREHLPLANKASIHTSSIHQFNGDGIFRVRPQRIRGKAREKSADQFLMIFLFSRERSGGFILLERELVWTECSIYSWGQMLAFLRECGFVGKENWAYVCLTYYCHGIWYASYRLKTGQEV